MDILRPYGLLFIVAGIILIVTGLVLVSGYFPRWIGRLPGDIHITRDTFSFHFPLATCLVISAVLTAVFYLIRIFLSSR